MSELFEDLKCDALLCSRNIQTNIEMIQKYIFGELKWLII